MIAMITAIAVVVAQPVVKSLTIEGVKRTAYIYPGKNADKTASPLVFVFHGHGGRALGAARRYGIQDEWPEATVVYPQGLDTYSDRLKNTGPGWQMAPNQDGGRDLKFVDALLKDIKATYKVDMKRVNGCGMSNGAAFTFLLLQSRPSDFTSFAEVAGAGGLLSRLARSPKPYLMTIGKNDPLVSPALAKASRDNVMRLNECEKVPKDWGDGWQIYKGKNGKDVVWKQHSGGHTWPESTTKAIVRFFKEH